MKDTKKPLVKSPKRLFIIGNGFDLMHGLKTSYCDFRTYLIEHGITSKVHLISNSSRYLIDFFDKYCKGTKWSDIEDKLLNVVFEVDDIASEKIKNISEGSQLYSELLRVLVDFLYHLDTMTTFFYEWVNCINLDGARANINFQLLTECAPCAFLSFNYTPVLENLYNATNVCHIHGQQNSKIIVGHKGNGSDTVADWLLDYIESTLYLKFMNLKKNTRQLIDANAYFFAQTTKWKEIYSYGFSFSEVDLPYIEEVCKKADTSTVWYLSDYEDSNTRESYKQIIRECGFVGAFELFHI